VTPLEVRRALLEGGFIPTPVHGKAPVMTGWQSKLTLTREEVAFWSKSYPEARSTGILTRLTPGFDIDILDPELAEAIERLVFERFEKDGAVILPRIGLAPKRLILFRSLEPIKKIEVRFRPRVDAYAEGFELLGDGQQAVVHGIHEVTRKPYRWPKGSLSRFERADLPLIDAALAQRLIEDATELAVAMGYEIKVGASDDLFNVFQGEPLDLDELVADMAPGNVHVSAAKLIGHLCFFDRDPESVFAKAYPLVLEKSKGRRGRESTAAAVEREVRRLIHDFHKKDAKKEREEPSNGHAQEPSTGTPLPVGLVKLWVFKTGAEVPRRGLIYGRHYVRKFCSCTIGLSGAGKSNLVLVEAVAMASGHNLLGDETIEPVKVWHHNAEEPMEELDRRLAAICQHYGIRREDIDHNLFVTSGRDTEIILGKKTKTSEFEPNQALVTRIKHDIKANGIAVVQFDPIINVYDGDETNRAFANLTRLASQIADECDCAIELEHHSRKTGGEEVTVEHARGGSSLIGGVRSARIINTMTSQEAQERSIAQRERRRFFRLENGKSNLYVPTDDSQWFELVSVMLDNGDAFVDGDRMGVATRCELGEALDGIDADAIARVLEAARQGGPWRRHKQSQQWIGHLIAEVLGLENGTPATDRQVNAVIVRCIDKGQLKIVRGRDSQRRPREFLEAQK